MLAAESDERLHHRGRSMCGVLLVAYVSHRCFNQVALSSPVMPSHRTTLLLLQQSYFTPAQVEGKANMFCNDGSACTRKCSSPSREYQETRINEHTPEMEQVCSFDAQSQPEGRVIVAEGHLGQRENALEGNDQAVQTLALQDQIERETLRVDLEELEKEKEKRRELEELAAGHEKARREVEKRLEALQQELEKEKERMRALQEGEEGKKDRARATEDEWRKLVQEERERCASAAAKQEKDEAEQRAKEEEERIAAAAQVRPKMLRNSSLRVLC